MPILPGRRLGPYEIFSAIGAGGMGDVYRAHDTKLGRDVAIKVLPQAFEQSRAIVSLPARSQNAGVVEPSEHRDDPRTGAV